MEAVFDDEAYKLAMVAAQLMAGQVPGAESAVNRAKELVELCALILGERDRMMRNTVRKIRDMHDENRNKNPKGE